MAPNDKDRNGGPNRLPNTLAILDGSATRPTDVTLLKRPDKTAIPVAARERAVKSLGRIMDASARNSGADVMGYARQTVTVSAASSIENLQIIESIPEVQQAIYKIIIPSIISPNDFKEDNVTYRSTCTDISEEKNTQIAKMIRKRFEDEMKLSSSYGEWIAHAKYIYGAKILVTIPLSSMEDMFAESRVNNPAATESEIYDSVYKRTAEISPYGLSDSAIKRNKKPDTPPLRHSMAALENDIDILMGKIGSGLVREESYDGPKNTTEKREAITSFYSSVVESVTILDNTDVLAADKLLRERSEKTLSKRRQPDKHKPSQFSTVPSQKKNATEVDHPLFLQPSAESVIPIISPNNPREHIGYFIAQDNYGTAINLSNSLNNIKLPKIEATGRREAINSFYHAHGFGDLKSFASNGTINHFDTMSEIYRRVIEAHLNDRLKDAGYRSFQVGSNNAVYEAMFTRYLNHRGTRLLFVPAEMVTYLAYHYNDNGTGKSKLEEIKFPLSIYLSLTTARTISQMNNAIDRRKATIRFPDNYRGNVLEYAQTVKAALVKKELVGFPLDYRQAADSINQKGITVKIANVPGAENYEIEHVNAQRGSAEIDEQLFTNTLNQVITGLDTPPSAMNAIGEFEFMRSIAVTNIFFSRFIDGQQRITCEKISEFLRSYIRFSGPLMAELRKILTAGDHKTVADSDDDTGIVDEKAMQDEALNALIERVLAGIEMRLPSANIAPSKAQFEALTEFTAAIDSMLQMLYDPVIAGDDTASGQVLDSIRALTKHDIIRQAMGHFGIGTEVIIPDFRSITPSNILAVRQVLINLKKAVDDLGKVTGGNEITSNGPSFDGGSSFGGPDDTEEGPSEDEGVDDETGMPPAPLV